MLLPFIANRPSVEVTTFQADIPITILLPFEPHMRGKSMIEHQLSCAMHKTERILADLYPVTMIIPVMSRLQHLVSSINYSCFKKSIALFVSAVTEKVFYLDIELEEKVIAGRPFSLGNLIANKKQQEKLLVLWLQEDRFDVYEADNERCLCVDSNLLMHSPGFDKDIKKERITAADLYRFMMYADSMLSMLLTTYPFPVIVAGEDYLVDYFWSTTVNEMHIAGFLPSKESMTNETELLTHLQPWITDWQQVKVQSLLQQVEQARKKENAVWGCCNIVPLLRQGIGGLLIVSGTVLYGRKYTDNFIIPQHWNMPVPFYCFNDTDNAIELALMNDIDVEVIPGFLDTFNDMVLLPVSENINNL